MALFSAASGAATSELVTVGYEGYEAKISQESSTRTKVTISRENNEGRDDPFTWADFISSLQADAPAVRKLLTTVLRERVPFDAFFWECPPVTWASARARRFEFVAIDAPHLRHISADTEPFAEFIDKLQGQAIATSFLNLGRDSMLVAPAQASADVETYKHISAFVRKAPEEQIDFFWRELGRAIEQRFKTVSPKTTVWVSTEGSGVYWL